MCTPHGRTPNLLTSSQDNKWRAVRKAVAVAFSANNIRKKFPVGGWAAAAAAAAAASQLGARACPCPPAGGLAVVLPCVGCAALIIRDDDMLEPHSWMHTHPLCARR